MINNDIENQINNKQIKKISCVACTIISSTFIFCSLIVYVLTKSYK